MTQYLPPNLLALFSARPPIPFKPPVDGLKKRKNAQPYSGIADFLGDFEDTLPPPATRGETREEKEKRMKKEKKVVQDAVLEAKLAEWDPHTDPNAVGDPFKTLFVGRVSYETTESKLRRALEEYGPVRRVHMVHDVRTNKPRGYGFVEFERERDMYSAYKHADGKKISGRRILVDVERGRTVKSWRPRKLGEGLGGTRRGGPDENIKHSGRVEQWEREKDRDRDRGEKRDRKRSRSRDRDRDRERRKDRDRDRDRDRSRRDDRKRDDRPETKPATDENGVVLEGGVVIKQEPDDGSYDTKERSRDRERSRDSRRDRDRDRDRDKERRRDRDRDRSRDRGREREAPPEIKEEPLSPPREPVADEQTGGNGETTAPIDY